MRTITGENGSVMVHVLIVAVVVSFLAVGMSQLLLTRYTLVKRSTEGAAKKAEAKEILNRLLTHWSASQTYCSTPPNPAGSIAINCSGATTSCGACSCSVGGGGQVYGSGTYPDCALEIRTSP